MSSLLHSVVSFNEKVQNISAEFGDTLCSLDEIGDSLQQAASEMVKELVVELIENFDKSICNSRKLRKRNHWRIIRKDPRTILLGIGEIKYTRTYMLDAKNMTYLHPVDCFLGVQAYSRITEGVSTDLVKTARKHPYAEASREVCDGKVSKQTVMNKLRKALPEERPEKPESEKICLKYLHIDADEAHTRVIKSKEENTDSSESGKATKPVYIPYACSYEGLDTTGKRHFCRNRMDFSEYGEKTDDFCEHFLTELEKKYDLSKTTIYLHCDGGQWLKTLSEMLPRCKVVLDPYHTIKYCKKMASGLAKEEHDTYAERIFKAVDNADHDALDAVYAELKEKHPERLATIQNGYDYLTGHWKAILIRKEDAEAKNGGASEPHTQHILSCRINGHGKWSEKTLKHMAPLLSNTDSKIIFDSKKEECPKFVYAIARKVGRKASVRTGLGLVNPELAANLSVLTDGKVSALSKALRAMAN